VNRSSAETTGAGTSGAGSAAMAALGSAIGSGSGSGGAGSGATGSATGGRSGVGTQSVSHRAQRTVRPGNRRPSGTSYAAAQAGQTILMRS
jgi:hypothetical protein